MQDLIAVNLTECGDGYDELTLIARPSCGYILQHDRVPFAIELELLGLFYCQLRPSLEQCAFMFACACSIIGCATYVHLFTELFTTNSKSNQYHPDIPR